MTSITYLDFDLQLERAEQGYRVQIVDSPTGQASHSFALPFAAAELENFLVLAGRPRQPVRSNEATDVAVARAFGGRLFEKLFSGPIRDGFQSSLTEAERQHKGLRIRLRINDAPELADIPWEYLYRADADRFLVLSAKTPLVRYLELPGLIRPLNITPPLRILAVLTSPSDYPPLDLEAEWRRLHAALRNLEARGLATLDRLEHPTPTTLQAKLRQGAYHIFHFIGHGGFDAQTQDGLLLLEDAQGKGSRISGHELGVLLQDHRDLRLALLNACEGGRSGRRNLFDGVAQNLVRQGIPAVIAMQFPVSDQAAIHLATSFYSALVDGYPVDAALAEARKQIFTTGDNLEWGTPVLYLRTRDGQIFEIAAAPLPAPIAGVAQSVSGKVTLLSHNWRTGMILVAAVLLLVVVGLLLVRALRNGVGTQDMPTISATTDETAEWTTTSLDSQQIAPAVSLTPVGELASPLPPPIRQTGNALATPTVNQPTGTALPATEQVANQPVSTARVAATASVSDAGLASQTNANDTWQEVMSLDRHAGPVNSVTFSRDGKWIATVGADQVTRVWDAQTGEQIAALRDPEHTENNAAFSPDGKLLATAGTHVRLWQTATWQPLDLQDTQLGEQNEKSQFYPAHVEFSSDGKRLGVTRLTGYSDLSVWEVGTWKQLLVLRNPAHTLGISFSPDGYHLIVPLEDNTARVWDWQTRDTTVVLRGHSGDVLNATFSPDGRRVATAGGDDKTARIWELAASQSPIVLSGHKGIVYTAVFSPDGTQVLTSSDDGTARTWDASTGANLAVLLSPQLRSATFSPDGARIATTSANGAAHIWAKALR